MRNSEASFSNDKKFHMDIDYAGHLLQGYLREIDPEGVKKLISTFDCRGFRKNQLFMDLLGLEIHRLSAILEGGQLETGEMLTRQQTKQITEMLLLVKENIVSEPGPEILQA